MPVQSSTDYTATHIAAFEGQRVELGIWDVDSKVLEDTFMGFGLAVVQGTEWDQAKAPSGTGGKFLGVSLYTTAGVVKTDGSHGYHEYDEMDIITFGRVWVRTEVAVSQYDPVYFRHTVNTDETIGAFRNDADTDKADLVADAYFDRPAGAGELVPVKLLPR